MERHAMVRSLSHTSMWLTWHRSWFGFTVNSIWITVTLIWVNHTGSCSVNYHRCIIQRQLTIRSVWIVSVRLKWGCAILSTAALQGEWGCLHSGAAVTSVRYKPLENLTPVNRWRRSGQEELPHVQGQGRWRRGATPRPRLRVAADRSYPASKVRSSSCALLEQLWRDTPRPR